MQSVLYLYYVYLGSNFGSTIVWGSTQRWIHIWILRRKYKSRQVSTEVLLSYLPSNILPVRHSPVINILTLALEGRMIY